MTGKVTEHGDRAITGPGAIANVIVIVIDARYHRTGPSRFISATIGTIGPMITAET